MKLFLAKRLDPGNDLTPGEVQQDQDEEHEDGRDEQRQRGAVQRVPPDFNHSRPEDVEGDEKAAFSCVFSEFEVWVEWTKLRGGRSMVGVGVYECQRRIGPNADELHALAMMTIASPTIRLSNRSLAPEVEPSHHYTLRMTTSRAFHRKEYVNFSEDISSPRWLTIRLCVGV